MKIIELAINFFIIFFIYNFSVAKILIFTYSYNQPGFIELQEKGFKKFLKDEYEFIVFNDAIDTKLFNEIHNVCDNLNIKCIDIPQEIHNKKYDGWKLNDPSSRNCSVVNYSLKNFGVMHDDILVLLDSDVFLIKEFCIRNFLEDNHVSAWLKKCSDQETHGKICKDFHSKPIEYFWIGLVILNMKTLPDRNNLDFSCGTIDNIGLDSGAYTYKYIKNNKNLKVKKINILNDYACLNCTKKNSKVVFCNHNNEIFKKLNFSHKLISLIQEIPIINKEQWRTNPEFFLNDTFIHSKAGSNYQGVKQEILQLKFKKLEKLINNI